jgi:hypothetical protein
MKKYRILLFLLFAGKLMMAQIAATNTGTLYISNNSSIFYSESHFTNNSGAALTNNGHLYIRGNLTNNQSSVSIGTGTLYFNGTSVQILGGSQPFRTFNFVSNNAAGITLNSNLSVSGAHTFTNGIITTSVTPTYLIYEAGSSYSGDGDASHVRGWVKKLGSTNFVFPVGNGTVERTIALNSLSAPSEFNVTYLSTTPNITQRQLPIRMVNAPEYWSITKISGGSATVTMNWDYSKVYFPNWIVPDIVTGGYNGSLWTDNGGVATGNPMTTGTITSNIISSFSLFTFATKSFVLPLALVDFTAKRQNNYSLIEWSTEKEVNMSHFAVERSDNGSFFYSISKVPARNSGITELYSARDNVPIQRIAYYRLRITDQGGQEKFSRVVAVTDGNSGEELVLLTNPVQSRINLLASSKLSGTFHYQLNMMSGQLVQQGELSIRNGGQYDIPVNSKLRAGTYSLKVVNQQHSFYYKIIIL